MNGTVYDLENKSGFSSTKYNTDVFSMISDNPVKRSKMIENINVDLLLINFIKIKIFIAKNIFYCVANLSFF
jgi:hypothetical protein